MKKLLTATTALLITTLTFGAELTVTWLNGDNPETTVTAIFYSTTQGSYPTNQFVIVPYPYNSYTFTNLSGGRRYYFIAKHVDPVDGDVSLPSNEANGKTKMNPPKNMSVGQP